MTTPREMSPLRARLECELQNRLASRRQESASARPASTLTAIELVCRGCEGVNESDANFCKHCGSKFNVSAQLKAATAGNESRVTS